MITLAGVGNADTGGQVHKVHVEQVSCGTCHGEPPNVMLDIQARNGSVPGQYIVCEQCHAPPPESMKPSSGNLITIHLSRGMYCTGCHNMTDTTHPSSPDIKCENCHPAEEKSVPHVNGGKYCMDCHSGAGPTVTVTPSQDKPTTTITASQDKPTVTYTQAAVPSNLEKEVTALKERLNRTDEIQSKQEARISGLESLLRSLSERISSFIPFKLGF